MHIDWIAYVGVFALGVLVGLGQYVGRFIARSMHRSARRRVRR